jgi:methylenetetrahydrofolate reductase (NADPH)
MVKRMADMSGAALPGWLADRLDATDDPDEVRRIGVDVATNLCAQLLEAGAPGIHLYALNRPDSVLEICANLNSASR